MMNLKKINNTAVIIIFLGYFFYFVSFPAAAHAENLKPKLSLKTTAEKEVIKIVDGRKVTQNIPVTEAKTGDIIVYTIDYKNEGMIAAQDAFIVDPIPQKTCYIENSATAAEKTSLVFSIDCGNTFGAWPLKIKLKKDNGAIEEKNAPLESYTHIKWIFQKVMPGESGKLKFKVKML